MATVWAFVDNREVCASWGCSLHGSRSGVIAGARAVWSRGSREGLARWAEAISDRAAGCSAFGRKHAKIRFNYS